MPSLPYFPSYDLSTSPKLPWVSGFWLLVSATGQVKQYLKLEKVLSNVSSFFEDILISSMGAELDISWDTR